MLSVYDIPVCPVSLIITALGSLGGFDLIVNAVILNSSILTGSLKLRVILSSFISITSKEDKNGDVISGMNSEDCNAFVPATRSSTLLVNRSSIRTFVKVMNVLFSIVKKLSNAFKFRASSSTNSKEKYVSATSVSGIALVSV